MSRLQSNGDDYPEAAGKHLQDASVLMDGARHDGTAYLAGYVVECALKTLIQMQTKRFYRSHDLQGLDSTLGTIAALADRPTKQMYASARKILRGADILAWNPEMRYQAADVTDSSTAGTWLREAKYIYSLIIGELKKDGKI